jgi:hypothetical protein
LLSELDQVWASWAAFWLVERVSVLAFRPVDDQNRLRMDSVPDVPSFA